MLRLVDHTYLTTGEFNYIRMYSMMSSCFVRFLIALTEEHKNNFKETYKSCQNDILSTLVDEWGVDKQFEGSYLQDYQTLQNQNTCFLDSKTTRKQKDLTDVFNPLLQYLHAVIQVDMINSALTSGTPQAKISKYLVATPLQNQDWFNH